MCYFPTILIKKSHLITAAPVEVFNLDDRNRYRQKNLARQKGEGNSSDQREVDDTHPTNETKEMSKRQLTRHIVEMAFIVDHADYAK